MEDFFEGREKTVRVYFDVPECRSLLDIDTEIWAKLLEQTGCSIIGELRQKEVTAYILSESSLFVWRDHILLKTCGTTTPLLLLPLLQKQLGWLEGFEWFSYTNGAFLKPQLQPSGYRSKEELELQINNTLLGITTDSSTYYTGSTFSFSDGSLQHVSVHRQDHISPTHPIIEIKLTALQESGKFYAASNNANIEEMFSDLFQEPWKTNHFHFEPCGFSLNALLPESKESYATIHVTPERHFSYVSYETNHYKELKSQLRKLHSLFCPRELVITAQFPALTPGLSEKGEKYDDCCDVADLMSGLDFKLKYFEESVLGDRKIVSCMFDSPQVEW